MFVEKRLNMCLVLFTPSTNSIWRSTWLISLSISSTFPVLLARWMAIPLLRQETTLPLQHGWSFQDADDALIVSLNQHISGEVQWVGMFKWIFISYLKFLQVRFLTWIRRMIRSHYTWIEPKSAEHWVRIQTKCYVECWTLLSRAFSFVKTTGVKVLICHWRLESVDEVLITEEP